MSTIHVTSDDDPISLGPSYDDAVVYLDMSSSAKPLRGRGLCRLSLTRNGFAATELH